MAAEFRVFTWGKGGGGKGREGEKEAEEADIRTSKGKRVLFGPPPPPPPPPPPHKIITLAGFAALLHVRRRGKETEEPRPSPEWDLGGGEKYRTLNSLPSPAQKQDLSSENQFFLLMKECNVFPP